MNTVRQMLFLPTTREEKYKAKQVIDSFVVRSGACCPRGRSIWARPSSHSASRSARRINVALVVAWLALSVATGLEFRRRVAAQEAGGT